MSKGVLVDITRCIGCRGCQAACKNWNRLRGERTTCRGTGENPAQLSPETWTRVRFIERFDDDRPVLRFVKTQCMHCLSPACASACLVKAMERQPDGAVTWDESRCMGCRYCMIACPFDIPKFEYDRPIPRIRKCQFCFDRQEAGHSPACVKTCPSGALAYGDREELLDAARSRIAHEPDRYVHHIYGEREAGGTSWMYISDLPFTAIGLPKNIDATAYPELTRDFLFAEPLVFLAIPALLLALSQIRKNGVGETVKEEPYERTG